jgi:hypothetical protein
MKLPKEEVIKYMQENWYNYRGQNALKMIAEKTGYKASTINQWRYLVNIRNKQLGLPILDNRTYGDKISKRRD